MLTLTRGTPAGDPQEAEAINRAFFDGRKDSYPNLLVGSVKTVVGHTGKYTRKLHVEYRTELLTLIRGNCWAYVGSQNVQVLAGEDVLPKFAVQKLESHAGPFLFSPRGFYINLTLAPTTAWRRPSRKCE